MRNYHTKLDKECILFRELESLKIHKTSVTQLNRAVNESVLTNAITV